MELKQLECRLQHTLQVDRLMFKRRGQRLAKGQVLDENDPGVQALLRDIDASIAQVEQRRRDRPVPSFPDTLPITARCGEIKAAIADQQVVIVCGETGSGKSTQLPKICLEMGRGVTGLIGHTQPRRIAARTVAARVAEELNSPLGQAVGYKIRFRDEVGPKTYIKLMTDGILLAETQGDRFLNAYDTLIIDEAHERSLNIDFLLGYLKMLLPKRPDLKVIITSATIDPERFSRHFDDAPIIEVSGRTYPVEVRYRPLVETATENGEEKDLQQGILDAVAELSRIDQGDILIFLAGERDIRETTDSLRKQKLRNTEILPLYAKQGTAEQNRIFQPHIKRHIILATNVAETSLTVPGIRYVIDPGYARISRYSPRSKVQRLPIEKISQASANQRKGRCGRVSEGVCIRLYSEDDFVSRPLFTDPEIKRTSLAAVILQLSALRFGQIEAFPFLEPPEERYIRDGYRLLEELGAVDDRRRLTKIGHKLAKLPVDPRIGRMILAAHDLHCLSEVLIIASALSVQDVRDKPMDRLQPAEEAHARFADENSDFLWFVNLWTFYQEQRQHLSQNKMRKLCKTNFLNFMRMREWLDIHAQLKRLVADLGFSLNHEPASYEAIHTALLSGLLGNVGRLSERNEYLGARGIRFFIFPGSGQFKRKPKWMLCAELVETSKLYARINARIEPEWVIRAAGNLVKRSYSDAHWSKKAGRVLALEKITLYGLILAADRKVNYGPIDPVEARKLFILGALVAAGETHARLDVLEHNRRLIAEVEDLEHRTRRMDILVDELAQFEFYDQRIPEHIHNIHSFGKWYREIRKKDPRFLFFDRDFLIREEAETICTQQFPDALELSGMSLPLSYHFEPGASDDGVTLTLPVAVLNQLPTERLEWLVPGLIKEKMTALIRSLPKSLRRNFVPAPNFAEACFNALPYGEGSLTGAMGRHLKKMTGIEIPNDAWDLSKLPDHLRMKFRVIDAHGHELSTGRDLACLQGKHVEEIEQSFSAEVAWTIERDNLTSWDFGDLPDVVETERDGLPLKGYPALVDQGDCVDIQVLDTAEKARERHRYGLIRIIRLVLRESMRYMQKNLPEFEKMAMLFAPAGKKDALKEDLLQAIVDRVFLAGKGLIYTEDEFNARLDKGRGELVSTANALCQVLMETLTQYHLIRKRLSGQIPMAWLAIVQEIQQQLDQLIYPGFILKTPDDWLQHLPRYLKAIEVRLEKAERDPVKDKKLAASVCRFWDLYTSINTKTSAHERFHWMLEEYRVSLFAQELGTSITVSDKRLEKFWNEIT